MFQQLLAMDHFFDGSLRPLQKRGVDSIKSTSWKCQQYVSTKNCRCFIMKLN
jgi:hypothetical protein